MAGRAERKRRARTIGAAASLALHAAVLSWLGLHVAPALQAPPPLEEAPLTVELVRPPTRAATPTAVRPAAPRAAPLPVPAPAPREAVVTPRPRPAAPPPRALAPRPLPLPPVSSGATARGGPAAPPPGPAPAGPRPAPGPLPGQEMQGDLRGLLRATVGCSHEEYLRLTPAERARCDTAFAAAARTTPPLPLPDDRLAEFARGADANARKRARREGPLYNPVTSCEIGTAAADKGLGCLPPDAVHAVAKF